MADVHDPAVRSRNMAAIKSSDTKPELLVRRAMHSRGLRYRLHQRDLPGRPDLVFSRYRAVVFVHGCFFHGHDCHLFHWPRSNSAFWREKIGRNIERDKEVTRTLLTAGWRVGVVWECALKGKARLNGQEAMGTLAAWIREGGKSFMLKGNPACSIHSKSLPRS